MDKFYIAYGSNLNMDQMRFRCPQAIPIGTAELRDYKLMFYGHKNGKNGVLTVVPAKGHSVPVGVWLITELDEARLDIYEGYPNFYIKETVLLPVRLLADPRISYNIDGMLYRMTPGHHPALPTDAYYDTCEQGYNDFGFDSVVLGQAWADSYSA